MSLASVRVGIVGAGAVSAYHLRALKRLDHVTVVGICDPNEAAARRVAAAFGIPAVFPSLDAMVAAPSRRARSRAPSARCGGRHCTI